MRPALGWVVALVGLGALAVAAVRGPGGSAPESGAADAAARSAGGAAGPPTLRAACPAMGGSWSESQVRRYATVFDAVVVGASARAERVRLFHAVHPGMLVLAYTCGFDVHDDVPLHAWIEDRHPEWFLRDAAGRRLNTYRDPHRWALDCGRPEVRAFFADSARRRVRELGADGILEDNVLPAWDTKNLAPGTARLERYASMAEWRLALDLYLAALERAVAPATVAANQVLPWTRHARIVSVEQMPMGGPRWQEMVRALAALDTTRVPYLQHRLSGPDDPARAFVTASYLMAVRPGALLALPYDGPRDSVRLLPEQRLALGQPLGPAREEDGVWWRDFERARVLVNPTAQPRPAPWPGPDRSARAAPLPPLRAGIAWRSGERGEPLPGWVIP